MPAWLLLALALAPARAQSTPTKPSTLRAPVTASPLASKPIAISTPLGSRARFQVTSLGEGDDQGTLEVSISGGLGTTRLSWSAGAWTDRFGLAAATVPASTSRTVTVAGRTITTPTTATAPLTGGVVASSPVAGARTGSAASSATLSPAASRTETLRFRYFGPTEALPSEIPLTLTVQDDSGAKQSLTVTLLPHRAMKVAALDVGGQVVDPAALRLPASVGQHLGVQLQGFEHVAEVTMSSLYCLGTGGASGTLLLVDGKQRPADGAVRFTPTVALTGAGRCRLSPVVTYRVEAGGPEETAHLRMETAIQVSEPQRTTLLQTAAPLRARYPFRVQAGPGSTCEGTSSALGGGNHPVGMREEEGDLVFEIRSGPAGTSCTWTQREIPPRLMGRGDGVSLIRATYQVEGTEKCRATSGVGLPGGVQLERLSFMDGLVIDDDADATAVSKGPLEGPGDMTHQGVTRVWGAAARGNTWLVEDPPLTVRLDCDATGTNDHFVRLRITELQYRHPALAVVP